VEVTGEPFWQECNTYGSFDPDEPLKLSYFRTCSGHGIWDPEKYHCNCDSRWNAFEIGKSPFDNTTVYSCKKCFGFWGPAPPVTTPLAEVTALHCNLLFTPDEKGDLKECGGHGVFENGACNCHQSQSQGFWHSFMEFHTGLWKWDLCN
jgi:hypothetical protein